MRRDRRSDPLPMRPKDEPPPSRWERIGAALEIFGLGVLTLAGLTSAAWGAVKYFGITT